MIWREDPGLGQSGIWYTYSVLDVPSDPIIPLERDSVSNIKPASVSTEEPVSVIPFPEDTEGTPLLVNKSFLPDFLNQPAGPLIFGIMIVFSTLVVVIIIYRFRRKG
jgi:hypothetical protein